MPEPETETKPVIDTGEMILAQLLTQGNQQVASSMQLSNHLFLVAINDNFRTKEKVAEVAKVAGVVS